MADIKLSGQIYQTSDKTDYYIRISLESNVKIGVLASDTILFKEAGSAKKIFKGCALMGALLAQHQNNMYGDNHDEIEVAKKAEDVAKTIYFAAMPSEKPTIA